MMRKIVVCIALAMAATIAILVAVTRFGVQGGAEGIVRTSNDPSSPNGSTLNRAPLETAESKLSRLEREHPRHDPAEARQATLTVMLFGEREQPLLEGVLRVAFESVEGSLQGAGHVAVTPYPGKPVEFSIPAEAIAVKVEAFAPGYIAALEGLRLKGETEFFASIHLTRLAGSSDRIGCRGVIFVDGVPRTPAGLKVTHRGAASEEVLVHPLDASFRLEEPCLGPEDVLWVTSDETIARGIDHETFMSSGETVQLSTGAYLLLTVVSESTQPAALAEVTVEYYGHYQFIDGIEIMQAYRKTVLTDVRGEILIQGLPSSRRIELEARSRQGEVGRAVLRSLEPAVKEQTYTLVLNAEYRALVEGVLPHGPAWGLPENPGWQVMYRSIKGGMPVAAELDRERRSWSAVCRGPAEWIFELHGEGARVSEPRFVDIRSGGTIGPVEFELARTPSWRLRWADVAAGNDIAVYQRLSYREMITLARFVGVDPSGEKAFQWNGEGELRVVLVDPRGGYVTLEPTTTPKERLAQIKGGMVEIADLGFSINGQRVECNGRMSLTGVNGGVPRVRAQVEAGRMHGPIHVPEGTYLYFLGLEGHPGLLIGTVEVSRARKLNRLEWVGGLVNLEDVMEGSAPITIQAIEGVSLEGIAPEERRLNAEDIAPRPSGGEAAQGQLIYWPRELVLAK